jgi:hypothetical protein
MPRREVIVEVTQEWLTRRKLGAGTSVQAAVWLR